MQGLGISGDKSSIGVRLGVGIGMLLGSLLLLGIFFSLQTRFTNKSVRRLVALQDPKADSAYEMKIALIDTNLAVLNYLQDHEEQHIARISHDEAEFHKACKVYLEMAQNSKERALARRLAADYQDWMKNITELVRLDDEQYAGMQGLLKDLDKLDVILNRKIRAGTKQSHWIPSIQFEKIADLDVAIEDLRKNLAAYWTDSELRYERRIKRDMLQFAVDLEAYGKLSLSQEEAREYKEMRFLFGKVKSSIGNVLTLTRQQAMGEDQFQRLRRRLNDTLSDEIQLPLEKSRAQARDSLEARLSRANTFVFIFVLAVVAFGLSIAIVTAKSITDPVGRLMAGMETAARGDLAYRVQVESKDELGRLAKSFNQMLEALQSKSQELERSNEELEEFAYASSHDLQEPLRKIANYAELLQLRCQDGVDQISKEHMATIVSSAKRMIILIRDLLAYARVSRAELVLAPVDMNEIARQAVSDLEIAIRDSGAAVSIENLPQATANKGMMEELFENLISNAVKFKRSDPPKVRIAAARQGMEWKFSVEDNGIGIEPMYLERIFLVFERLHSRAEYPGTGIGLAVCRKIVERHGGRIWAESELGKGSTFHFTLPAAS